MWVVAVVAVVAQSVAVVVAAPVAAEAAVTVVLPSYRFASRGDEGLDTLDRPIFALAVWVGFVEES